MRSTAAERASDPGMRPTCAARDRLVLLAAPATDPAALARALERVPREDLPRLLGSIAHHRIDGLAHRALETLPEGAADPWLRSALRRRHQRFAAATLSQGLALAEILESLERAGVPVSVMRGLRSVEWIYGDNGRRPFEDHDLLVRARDLDGTRDVLARCGFEEAAPGLHRRGGVLVDLHTDPLGARRRPGRGAILRLPTDELLARARPGRVAGAPALLLSLEDELLLLAIHVVKHSFDRLIRVADIAHLVNRHRRALCWTTLRRRAARGGALRALGWALCAARPLGVEVPADLDPAPGGLLERAILRRALALRPVPYGGDLLLALSAPTPSAAARFLIDALLPPGEAPAGILRRTAFLPARGVELLRQAGEQTRIRRAAR